MAEVVMALLVITVAVLGLGRTQWQAQRAAGFGFQSTLAEVQSLDMGERVWLDLRDPEAWSDDWAATHGASFPGWDGSVEVDLNDPELVRISIGWSAPGADSSPRVVEHLIRIPRIAP